jgi:hypothetical protein
MHTAVVRTSHNRTAPSDPALTITGIVYADRILVIGPSCPVNVRNGAVIIVIVDSSNQIGELLNL